MSMVISSTSARNVFFDVRRSRSTASLCWMSGCEMTVRLGNVVMPLVSGSEVRTKVGGSSGGAMSELPNSIDGHPARFAGGCAYARPAIALLHDGHGAERLQMTHNVGVQVAARQQLRALVEHDCRRRQE